MGVYTIRVIYDPTTRRISLAEGSGLYGGATIDSESVAISVTGIEPEGTDFSARIDFAVPMMTPGNRIVYKPFVVLREENGEWNASIPQAILRGTRETRKLPFQLVMRHGDTVINSSNTIVMQTTRAIDTLCSINYAYAPYVMYRNDTWEWVNDFTYGMGAVVTKDGELYISLEDNNLAHAPDGPDGELYWRKKAEGLPEGSHEWQILGRDDDSAEWRTLSEKHEVTTAANTELEIEHQFGDRPVVCTFFENGDKVEVPYTCGDGRIYIETTSAHTLTAVITAIPSEEII